MTIRQLLALLLVFAMVFSMAACEIDDKQDDAGNTQATTLPDPTNTEPVTTDGAGETEPSEKDPPATEPSETDPTETTATEPEVTEPTVTEPTVTEPVATQPKPTEPKPTEPKPTEPEPTEPKPTEPTPTEPEPTEPEQQEVTLTVWSATEDQLDESSWLYVMIERFEAEHPEYKFTWNVEAVSEADASTKITTDPENVADVYMFYNDQLGTLINLGALMKVGGSYKEQVLNDNSQTVVNTATYTDGQIYGFPVANNTYFMYYNKNVFTQDDIRSLDAMLEKGKVCYPMSGAWYTGAFFFATGCTAFGSKGNDASAGFDFGGQKGYGAARKMIELAANPNLVCSDMGWSLLTSGEVDAVFSGSWDYEGFQSVLGDALGVAPMPTIEIDGVDCQMKAFAGSRCVGVNPNAENQQVAMMFAAFLASKESQLERYRMRGVIPAAKDLANHPLLAASELVQAEINTMTYGAVAQPSVPEMNIYWDAMSTFAVRLVNGDITLENYKEEVDKLNERMNDF